MISCVIPTKNESANLPHAVSSLGWCDEIIVVDMDSDDGSVELARSMGAEVISVPNNPHFDMSRKVGLEAARNPWILALDADEMVPPGLASTLQRLADSCEHDLAVIPRLNFKFGQQRAGGLWPDYQSRFYRRDAVEFQSATHNYLHPLTQRILTMPPVTDNALYHFNYIPVEKQIAKLNAYTSADALAPSASMAAPAAWLPVKTFLSLHFKHGSFREGIQGLWWSAYISFYDVVRRQKKLALLGGSSITRTEEEVDDLNRETTSEALRRLKAGGQQHSASVARTTAHFLRGMVRGGVADEHGWSAARNAFLDLTIEVKSWEIVRGRALAERAQDEMRAVLAAQWAKQVV
jgi:hypothetical protein